MRVSFAWSHMLPPSAQHAIPAGEVPNVIVLWYWTCSCSRGPDVNGEATELAVQGQHVLLVNNGGTVMAFQNCRELGTLQEDKEDALAWGTYQRGALGGGLSRPYTIPLQRVWNSSAKLVSIFRGRRQHLQLPAADLKAATLHWRELRGWRCGRKKNNFYFIYLVGQLLTPLGSSARRIFWASG